MIIREPSYSAGRRPWIGRDRIVLSAQTIKTQHSDIFTFMNLNRAMKRLRPDKLATGNSDI
jgi:hypothetical protein